MTWVLNSTRIKQTFLRPTSDDGAQAPLWHSGFRRFCVTAVWGFLFLAGFAAQAAFIPAPKEAVKALKITKGKPFSSGVVFINGKFIEPPYVVERYGNVLRINKIQITNPVVEWSEFMKTQAGIDVAKADAAAIAHEQAPAAAPVTEPEPEPEPEKAPESKVEAMEISTDDSNDVLDDLFDDAPAKPKKSAAKPKTVAKRAAPETKPQPKPVAVHNPSASANAAGGGFVMTDRAKMLVGQINKKRTDIDMSLRRGCFYCFGSGYNIVSGDQGAANRILKMLPEIMKANSDYTPFYATLRKHGFVYFSPLLAKEIFKNRTDYLIIQKRWKKVQEELKFDKMMQDAGVSY